MLLMGVMEMAVERCGDVEMWRCGDAYCGNVEMLRFYF